MEQRSISIKYRQEYQYGGLIVSQLFRLFI